MGSMGGGQGKQDGEQKRLQTGNDMAGICVNGNGKRAKNNAPDGHRRLPGAYRVVLKFRLFRLP